MGHCLNKEFKFHARRKKRTAAAHYRIRLLVYVESVAGPFCVFVCVFPCIYVTASG